MPAEGIRRLEAVDAIRGLALGGMLIANLEIFSGTASVSFARLGILDRFASLTSMVLVQGKFYPVFGFLFGWGLAMQAKFHTRNYQLRRLALLGLFGSFHSILLWSGDILVSYALLGLWVVCWGERIYRRKWLFGMAVIACLLLSSFLNLPGIGKEIHAAILSWSAPLRLMIGQPGDMRAAQAASLPNASLDRLRVTLWKMIYFPDWLGNYFAAILCGYMAGRKGWIEQLLKMPEIALRRWASRFLWIGLSLNGVYAAARIGFWLGPQDWKPFGLTLTESLGGAVLAGFYLLVTLMVWQRLPRAGWLKGLSGMGRMSLSHYLIQSLLCGIVCYPYGFGLYGRISTTAIFPLAAMIFLLQAGFSVLWLKRFKFGPLEATWRWAAGGFSKPQGDMTMQDIARAS